MRVYLDGSGGSTPRLRAYIHRSQTDGPLPSASLSPRTIGIKMNDSSAQLATNPLMRVTYPSMPRVVYVHPRNPKRGSSELRRWRRRKGTKKAVSAVIGFTRPSCAPYQRYAWKINTSGSNK